MKVTATGGRLELIEVNLSSILALSASRQVSYLSTSSAKLRENPYTIVESMTHPLAVDVVLQDKSCIGTLFVGNPNGPFKFFIESLKDTNWNDMGYVDDGKLYGIDGVGLPSVISNAKDVEVRGAQKQLKTMVRCSVSDVHSSSFILHSIWF